MAYVTGVAANLSDIVTALRNACTANGWTLAGNVLHKGGCYVDIQALPKGTHSDFGIIQIIPGNGIDGSNQLTDTPGLYTTNWPACGVIGPMGNGTSTTVYNDWDWPVTYYIHILTNPDEVFLMVNYGSNQYWQGLSFGKSPSPGCPGTGNWSYASLPRAKSDVTGGSSGRTHGDSCVVVNPSGNAMSTYNGGVVPGAIPFWGYTMDQSSVFVPNPGLFHGVWMNDGVTTGWSHPRYYWNSSGNPGTAINIVCSSRVPQPLPQYSPNTWNGEAHLIRLQILSPRLEWKSSVVGEINHARFIRNDYLNDGEVIDIGGEKWKVYPAYRKEVTARNGGGGGGATHSGTCALAIRYDGV